jgi:DNA-directed RNA polymerase subunit RPC12/RpoP
MALIKCSECGKEVSPKATSCPGCGNPIAMKSGPFGGHEKGVTTRPGFWHDRNVGAVGFLVLLIFLLIIGARLMVKYGWF